MSTTDETSIHRIGIAGGSSCRLTENSIHRFALQRYHPLQYDTSYRIAGVLIMDGTRVLG